MGLKNLTMTSLMITTVLTRRETKCLLAISMETIAEKRVEAMKVLHGTNISSSTMTPLRVLNIRKIGILHTHSLQGGTGAFYQDRRVVLPSCAVCVVFGHTFPLLDSRTISLC